MRRITAAFCTGMIIGATIMNFIGGREVDRLHLQNRELQVQLYDMSLHVEKLQDQLSNEAPAVETIDVVITNREQLSPFVIVGIKQEVQKLTQDLIGQDLETVNPHLISRLLDNRVINVEDKYYRLSIKLIIIGEKTVVQTGITPLEERLEDEP